MSENNTKKDDVKDKPKVANDSLNKESKNEEKKVFYLGLRLFNSWNFMLKTFLLGRPRKK